MKDLVNELALLNKEQLDILNHLVCRGPITKGQIIELTGLKLTTLNRFIKPLAAAHLITEVGVDESSGGRKPLLYDINKIDFYLIGIDLSRTYTRIVLANLKMDIIDAIEFKMTPAHTPLKTIETVNKWIDKLMAIHDIPLSKLSGIGLGTIGPLNREKGIIYNTRKFAADWANVSIKELLSKVYSCPIMIDNGANGAVFVEKLFGSGRNVQNLAYINCGLGIRTGVMSDHHIVRSVQDSNNAFGHMVVDYDGLLCHCGKKGCLDCYCSLQSIQNNLQAYLDQDAHAQTQLTHRSSGLDILKAGDEGDKVATEIITEAARIFGIGLSNYMNIMDLTTIILSGPTIYSSHHFYQTAVKTAQENYLLGKDQMVTFIKNGAYRENSMALGSAALLLMNLLDATHS